MKGNDGGSWLEHAYDTLLEPVATTLGAAPGDAFCIELKFLARPADPAYAPGRIAYHQGMVGHIAYDDGSCTHQRIPPDLHTANDRGVGTHRTTLPQCGGTELRLALDETPGIHDVRENHRRPQEDIVLHHDTVVHRYVVLDLHSIPDADPVVDETVLADVAAGADHGSGHYMAKMPYTSTLADDCPCVDDGGGVDGWGVSHGFRLRWARTAEN